MRKRNKSTLYTSTTTRPPKSEVNLASRVWRTCRHAYLVVLFSQPRGRCLAGDPSCVGALCFYCLDDEGASYSLEFLYATEKGIVNYRLRIENTLIDLCSVRWHSPYVAVYILSPNDLTIFKFLHRLIIFETPKSSAMATAMVVIEYLHRWKNHLHDTYS